MSKVHRVIKFKQKAWLKTYIDINTKLRQEAKNNFEKDFFKLRNNAVFGKTVEDVWYLIRNYLVSEPNNPTTKFFSVNLSAIEMKKTQILPNKPVYLGLWILGLRKTVMYEYWYDYVKPKYGENAKLCYMDTDSFIVHVKTDDIYKDIVEDVETRFDTSNFEIDHYLKEQMKK